VLSTDPCVAPMYLSGDGGDASHPNAWLFLCWPAQHPRAARAGQMIINAIAQIAATELGAVMQSTLPPEGTRE